MEYRKGFTLLELIIVMTIFAIMAGFVTINLIKPQTSASVDATANVLASDLKAQQIKSMVGGSDSLPQPQNFGIYFESNKYTLFSGSVYNPNDPNNFIVSLDINISIVNNSFQQPTVFARRSGEVTGLPSGSNSLTVQNIETGDQKILTINRLGSLSVN